MRLVLLAGFQAGYRFLLPAPLIKKHNVRTGNLARRRSSTSSATETQHSIVSPKKVALTLLQFRVADLK